jgi:manganese oxidase
VRNALTTSISDLDGFNGLPAIIEGFNGNQIRPSLNVGLHAQLVAMDVSRYSGINAGLNRVKTQTAAPNRAYRYRWYAGHLSLQPNGTLVATPVEFGGVNLIPADPIKHSNKALIGALMIEPLGSTWVEDASSRLSATVTAGASSFREFVTLIQDDINLRSGAGNGTAICPVDGGTIALGCKSRLGNRAINYRTEPMWFRIGFDPGTDVGNTITRNFTNALSNSITGGADPAVPVFTARAGEDVRFRVLQPGGKSSNHVFQVHGHVWQAAPYAAGSVPSQTIANNPASEWYGAQDGVGPSSHFDIVLRNGAGGGFDVVGDYLIRDQPSFQFDGGIWAILRVTP